MGDFHCPELSRGLFYFRQLDFHLIGIYCHGQDVFLYSERTITRDGEKKLLESHVGGIKKKTGIDQLESPIILLSGGAC